MIALRHRLLELQLRHTFRIARGASDTRENLLIELEDQNLIGLGEAAPNLRYGQDCRSAARAVEVMAQAIETPKIFDSTAARAPVSDQSAAEAAVDMALRDLSGKRLDAPLYEVLGLDPGDTPPTSYTIGIDTPEMVVQKVREADDFEVLKIKLGSENDREILEAVRDVTNRPLWVDANEGWIPEEAEALLVDLEALGVVLVEQPFPAGQNDATRELRRRSPLPIFADESVHRAEDIPALVESFDGINIKLMKCGGIGEALRMIAVARAHRMQIMLGCMVESSLAITAAAHISPLVDYADLDGNLLVTNDPFVGVRIVGGRLVLPDAPGLGVTPRTGAGQ
ncbi:MAG: dipeptide epimerase [Thermoanaerobaculia bacterium]